MAVEIASVYVSIRPSVKGFSKEVVPPSTKAGESSAGAFSRAFHRRLNAAFRALPEAKIDADATSADRKIQELRGKLEKLSHKTVGVDLDASDAIKQISAIEAELTALGSSSANVQVKADVAAASLELAAVKRQAESLDGTEVVIKTRKTQDNFNAAFLKTSLLKTSIVALAPAAIPVMAVVSQGALGMAASFGAAGLAAGAFTAIAVNQFGKVTDVLDKMTQARERADKATTKKAREKALKEEQRLWETLTPTQQKAAKQIRALGNAWERMSNRLSKPVFDAVTPWIATARVGLGHLPKLVKPAATAIGTLGEEARKSIGSKYWRNWFKDVGQYGGTALYGLGHAAGNTAQGFAGLFRAWLPIGNRLLPDITNLTQRFNEWANSARATQALEKFFAYVDKVAPDVAAFFRELGPAIANIGHAAGMMAPASLAIATALAKIVAAMPPEFLTALLAGYLGLRVATAAWAAAQWTLHGALVIGSAAMKIWTAGAWLGTRAMGAATVATNALGVSALRTRFSLLAMAKTGGAIALLAAGAAASVHAMDSMRQSATGTVQSTDALTKSMAELARTGKFTGAFFQQFKPAVNDAKGSLTSFHLAAKEIVDPSFMQKWINHPAAEFLKFISLGTANTPLEEAKNKFKSLDSTLAGMAKGGSLTQAQAAFQRIQQELVKQGVSANQVTQLFPQYTAQVRGASASNAQLTGQIAAQNSALQRNAGLFASDEQQVIDFRLAMQNASMALRTNGQAFFGNSAKAIQNRQAVLQAAAAIRNHANDLVNNNRVTDANVARLKAQRAQLVRLIQSFGVSREQAKAYANQLVKIPKNLSTNIKVNARGSFEMMRNPGTVREFHYAGGGLIRGYASGGVVHGSGGPRSDSVSAQLSAGEFVVNARATKMFLPQLIAMNEEGNRGSRHTGKGYAKAGKGYIDEGNPRFAGGGMLHKYGHNKSSAAGLAAGRKDNQTGINRQLQYAVQQTVNYAKEIVKQMASGGSVVAAARSQLGVPYSWGGGGRGGKSRGIGRGANTVGFDCSGLTEYAWWKGRRVSIGGTTYSQRPNSYSVGKRPGALGFPHAGHVVIASNKPGQVIEAPYTGAHVREVRSSRGYDWRWPKGAAKFDNGGMLPPGLSLAYNATGKPEPVLTSGDWSAIHSMAAGNGGSGEKVTNNFYGKLDLNERTLDAWQRTQEAKARIGRPR